LRTAFVAEAPLRYQGAEHRKEGGERGILGQGDMPDEVEQDLLEGAKRAGDQVRECPPDHDRTAHASIVAATPP
jgi:hypothetical protein